MGDIEAAKGDGASAVYSDLESRLRQIAADFGEKQRIEAVAQLVEQLDSDNKLQQTAHGLWAALQAQMGTISALQGVLRDALMDLTLVKRALTSLGQIGVMERTRIEKELILELFPPRLVNPGTGVVVACARTSAELAIDCTDRLPLCKAACCRIYNAYLTAEEVESTRYDWTPRLPYALPKNRLGCIHLHPMSWSCTVHNCRPSVCSGYSCVKDQRIWADFEKRIVNPELKRELDKLENGPGAPPSQQPVAPPTSPATVATGVSPPDFSELRSMNVPEPSRKFVPPQSVEAAAGVREYPEKKVASEPEG